MKRRPTRMIVSDHAILRWLEREHGLDVAAVRWHLGVLAQNGAELGAVAVCVDKVRLVLKPVGDATVITTVLSRDSVFHPRGSEGGDNG